MPQLRQERAQDGNAANQRQRDAVRPDAVLDERGNFPLRQHRVSDHGQQHANDDGDLDNRSTTPTKCTGRGDLRRATDLW